MGEWVKGHRKGLLGALAALGAVCAAIAPLTDLGPASRWAGVVVAVLAAAGVYRVPNKQQPESDGPDTPGAARTGHPPAS